MKAFLGVLPMVFWIAGYAASGSTPESRATLKFSATPTVDLNCYMRGGGVRTFSGFSTNTQTYAYEQYDQTLLKRVAPANYEMTLRDSSDSAESFVRSLHSIAHFARKSRISS